MRRTTCLGWMILAPFLSVGCAHTGPAFLQRPPETAAAPSNLGPRNAARRQIAQALNIDFLLARLSTSPAAAVLSQADRGFYIEKKVRFDDPSIGAFDALVLSPKTDEEHRPAVIGLFDCDGSCPLDPSLRLGADLARRHYTVVSAVAHEDWLKDASFCGRLRERGVSMTGLRVYETLVMISYLRTLKEVDALRIGVIGRGTAAQTGELAARMSSWIAAYLIDNPPAQTAADACAADPARLASLPAAHSTPALAAGSVSYTAADPDAQEQASSFFNGVFSTQTFSGTLARAAEAVDAGERDLAERLIAPYRQASLTPQQDRSLAGLYVDLKDYAQAQEKLARLLKDSPDAPDLLFDRARAEAASGDRGNAIATLDKIVAAKPAGELLRRSALLYQDLKEFPQARRLFRQRTEAAPSSAQPLEDLAVCEYIGGEAEQAVSDLRKAISLEPDHLSSYVSLGSILAAGKRQAEALQAYDAALARPASPQTSDQRDAIVKARRELMPDSGSR